LGDEKFGAAVFDRRYRDERRCNEGYSHTYRATPWIMLAW